MAGGSDTTQHVVPLNGGAAPPDWWADLFERAANASIFLSPAWIQSWLEVYGHEFEGCWVRWDVADAMVGGCLILQRTVWRQRCPVPTLFINASGKTSRRSPKTEFNGPLYLPGFEAAIATGLAELLAARRWTCLSLSGYEESAITQALLAGLPLCDVEHEHRPSRYVDFSAVLANDYEATLSSKTRSQIRRSRRMYEEAHGLVRIEAPVDAEQAIEFLTELCRLHNATWRSRGMDGAFECPEFVEFHHRVIRRLWPVRGAEVLCARAGSRVIGYVYSFLRHGKVYCFQTGLVHEEDKNLKPGMLTHALAIRHYCERGFREYDFLSGDMRYKRSMAKSHRTLVWTTAYRRSTYSRLLLLARNVHRKLAARHLPAAVEVGDDEGASAEA